jgi:hypothetical protein
VSIKNQNKIKRQEDGQDGKWQGLSVSSADSVVMIKEFWHRPGKLDVTRVTKVNRSTPFVGHLMVVSLNPGVTDQ